MNIFSQIISFISTLIQWRKEISAAKHDQKLAAMQARTKLIQSDILANSEWSIAILAGEGVALRWAAFLVVTSPLTASIISPTWGAYIQQAWNQLPKWDAYLVSGICCAIFGLRPAHRLVGAIVGAIAEALRQPKLPPPAQTR